MLPNLLEGMEDSRLMPVPMRDFTVMRCRASVQRGHVGDELHHRTYGTNLFDRVTLLAAGNGTMVKWAAISVTAIATFSTFPYGF